jgi:DNA-binding beta-propeller fold protein YncE
MSIRAAILAAALLFTTPALAFDGWHLESSTAIPSKTSTWDYVAFEPGRKLVYIGHRREGLQVFDGASHSVIGVIGDTAAHSANGASFAPEFDLGISNNEDGTYTPFKLSTLEAKPSVKIAEGIDTSHYDDASKRFVFNTEPDKDGTDLIVMDAATQAIAGKIRVSTRKAEGAAADGRGRFFLAAQDQDSILVLDTKSLTVTATWKLPACGKPTGIDVDPANARVFVSCRGNNTVKPALVVLNAETGAVIYTSEIGGGSDSMVFDAASHRLFSANGINANLSVFEQTDADHYRLIETLGTSAWVKVLAMDHTAGRLWSITAEGTSDASKKINTAVSPWYINTVIPNTFRVLSYAK